MQDKLQPRLCSEIKLFDLCTLESCFHKDGRFCVNPLMLEKFEAVSESEDRFPGVCCDDEYEDGEESEFSDIYYADVSDDDEIDQD